MFSQLSCKLILQVWTTSTAMYSATTCIVHQASSTNVVDAAEYQFPGYCQNDGTVAAAPACCVAGSTTEVT
jgi:hypothetical protein